MNLTKDCSHDKRFVVYCAVKRQKALELSQLIYRLKDIKVIEKYILEKSEEILC